MEIDKAGNYDAHRRQQANIVERLNNLQTRIFASKHPDANDDTTRVAEISFSLGYKGRILTKEEMEELNVLHKKYKDYITNSPDF